MQHTITHNLSDFPDFMPTDLVALTIIFDGVQMPRIVTRFDRLITNAALIGCHPHPLAELAFRRALNGRGDTVDGETAPDTSLASYAEAVLKGRWRGEPWRWDQGDAERLFVQLNALAEDLTGDARKDADDMLASTANMVARAFMAPPGAEKIAMKVSKTAHEEALTLAIGCASTIIQTLDAKGLPAGGGIASWAECVEKLDAALSLVEQATKLNTEVTPRING